MEDLKPIGRIWRTPSENARKRDRQPAIRFGLPSRRQGGKRWTEMERWALTHGICVGEAIHDEDPLTAPIWERPGAKCLAMKAHAPIRGGVLIESLGALGDRFSQTVVIQYLRSRKTRVYVRVRPGSIQEADDRFMKPMLREFGGDSLQKAMDRYGISWRDDFVAAAQAEPEDVLDDLDGPSTFNDFFCFGVGPYRGADLAFSVATELQASGIPKIAIREYLELYGFTNLSGTVGRWSHSQFQRLIET